MFFDTRAISIYRYCVIVYEIPRRSNLLHPSPRLDYNGQLGRRFPSFIYIVDESYNQVGDN
ncbi:15907_t:CDS:2 [Racocetra fulgida]|uniref:15907_t:CDS:1 n=1 Tax=Racocetra fulgida TaxID=60492 RepID=A0A9N8W8T0_9GLOM|nr:15907_t:CDS:2 [Racocetra fulgida]